MRILALDPGDTTGYVDMEHCDDKIVLVHEAGQFGGWQELGRLIRAPIERVVYEKFAILSANVSPIPLQVIGVLKYVSAERGIITHGQMPNSRLAVLKRYPEIDTGIAKSEYPHRRDALLHGLTYLWHHHGGIDPNVKW